MEKIRTSLLALPRRHKRIMQVAADVCLIWFALWMAFVVRLGIDELINPLEIHTWLFALRPLLLSRCSFVSACTAQSCAISAMTR
jgi:hypothetical protein